MRVDRQFGGFVRFAERVDVAVDHHLAVVGVAKEEPRFSFYLIPRAPAGLREVGGHGYSAPSSDQGGWRRVAMTVINRPRFSTRALAIVPRAWDAIYIDLHGMTADERYTLDRCVEVAPQAPAALWVVGS